MDTSETERKVTQENSVAKLSQQTLEVTKLWYVEVFTN